ncbi:hypothetical protein PS655_05098 [Pseudomonas fluorescens]|uniref:Uncharacterized protein n=1 Tax=Pseudomonas fluorescens TaxID=294 RepID=A0A5E6X389_PSEFL|nr:hypothetical protein PS655_05098 [Pseudomonas fluorescens]
MARLQLHAHFGTPVNSILLCAVVALPVIFHYWIGGEKKGPRERVLFLLFPFMGLVADLWLMVSLDHLAVLTGGFRRQPPEMDFQEAT